jgi:hypothetical protein
MTQQQYDQIKQAAFQSELQKIALEKETKKEEKMESKAHEKKESKKEEKAEHEWMNEHEKTSAKKKHPVSEAQRRWAFAAEEKGELPEGKAMKWAKRAKGKDLPKHSKKHPKHEEIKEAAYKDEMNKIAKEDEKANVGYIKGLIGSARARAHGDKLRHLVNKGEYIKGVYSAGLKKEVPVGAAVGAASIGALSGMLSKKPKTVLLGAGIGALAGGIVGGEVSGQRFDRSYLKAKGITGVKGGYHFTEEARKKYRV